MYTDVSTYYSDNTTCTFNLHCVIVFWFDFWSQILSFFTIKLHDDSVYFIFTYYYTWRILHIPNIQIHVLHARINARYIYIVSWYNTTKIMMMADNKYCMDFNVHSIKTNLVWYAVGYPLSWWSRAISEHEKPFW